MLGFRKSGHIWSNVHFTIIWILHVKKVTDYSFAVCRDVYWAKITLNLIKFQVLIYHFCYKFKAICTHSRASSEVVVVDQPILTRKYCHLLLILLREYSDYSFKN